MAGRFSFYRAASPVPRPADLDIGVTAAAAAEPQAQPDAESDAPALLTAAAAAANAPPAPPAAANPNPLLTDKFLDAKVRLHRRLIEEINLSWLEKLPEDEMRRHVLQLVSQYTMTERLALNAQELADFVSEILDEMVGLGPLEPLLKDPTINDILINGHECIYVERHGLLERSTIRFKDEAHRLRIVNKIVAAVGRRVDEMH